MTRLDDLLTRYDIALDQMKTLQIEYSDKFKGSTYTTRYLQLVEKMNFLKRTVLEYGSVHTIIKVKGIRKRAGKKVKNLTVTERFELYFAGVDETDIPRLLKLRYPNIDTYNIEVIKPGITIVK